MCTCNITPFEQTRQLCLRQKGVKFKGPGFFLRSENWEHRYFVEKIIPSIWWRFHCRAHDSCRTSMLRNSTRAVCFTEGMSCKCRVSNQSSRVLPQNLNAYPDGTRYLLCLTASCRLRGLLEVIREEHVLSAPSSPPYRPQARCLRWGLCSGLGPAQRLRMHISCGLW